MQLQRAATCEWLCPCGSVSCNSSIAKKRGAAPKKRGAAPKKWGAAPKKRGASLRNGELPEDWRDSTVWTDMVCQRPPNPRKRSLLFFHLGISAESWANWSQEVGCLAHLDGILKVMLDKTSKKRFICDLPGFRHQWDYTTWRHRDERSCL